MNPTTEQLDTTTAAPTTAQTRHRIVSSEPSTPLEAPIEDTTVVPRPTREAIAIRAYELFLERGGEDGADVDDWLRAERELLDAESEAERLTIELNEKPAN